MRPGPTARTVPSCGFSLAVSGITRPDAVVVSASFAWTTMRSSSGLIATLVALVTGIPTWGTGSLRTSSAPGGTVGAGAGPAGRAAGRRPAGWHSHSEGANRTLCRPLALRQGECQPRAARRRYTGSFIGYASSKPRCRIVTGNNKLGGGTPCDPDLLGNTLPGTTIKWPPPYIHPHDPPRRHPRRVSRKDPCMRKGILAVATVGVVALSGLAACGKSNSPSSSSSTGNGKTPYIGVILPDSKSSVRWETADRPYLEKAFQAAGVKYDIQNAQGDKGNFQTIADQLLTKGVNVLVIVNLDSGSAATVLGNARKQGVATIDYDRLTLGGGADYYVSFENVAVAKLQGEGLVKCLTDMKATKPKVAELNGSPTDNNATLFAQGYNSVLDPKYADGTYVKGPNQSVPDWDNTQAGTIFEQMFTAQSDIKAVLSANDGLGNAVIQVLKKNNLNGQVPVTGQDATVQGLQHILDGDQCMTVYKAVKKEADATAQLAVALAKGSNPSVGQTVKDTTSGKDVKASLQTPEPIYKDTVKKVVDDGFVTKADLCAGAYAAKCTAAGIS